MTGVQPEPAVLTPRMIVVEDPSSALPLEHTHINAQITGPVAVVAVTQRFRNPLEEAVELEYLFPLPEDAAITGFTLRVGERRIVGSLREHETARADYEAARDAGKRAGLMEQRRPNLFAVRLANVRSGETVTAEMHYQQRLKYEEDGERGGYEFVYPMGLTPKYDSPTHPGEGEGVHAPVAQGERIGPVEIQVAADAGFAIGAATSPSHPIEVTMLDERRAQVRLKGEHIPDHDFVLRIAREDTGPRGETWVSAAAEGPAVFMTTLVPPMLEGDPEPPQREFIFVLDRSGSMAGQPIRQARNALRACLRALNLGDTFAILLFDNRVEWFRGEPVPVTQENIDAADAFLDKVEGRGGTEITGALDAALRLPADGQRGRVIVFLTDGAVSAEARLLEGLRKSIGDARLFAFGVGPSVNRALINRMAALGKGRAQFLQLHEDIEGAIIRFQDSIAFPALTGLALTCEGGEAADVYPARLPDLYYGQPLEICGRWKAAGKEAAVLIVKAERAGQPVEIRAALKLEGGRDPAIERIWARARVDDLLDQTALQPERYKELSKEITRLALEHGLVTPLTSFAAVEEGETGLEGKPRLIRVAQPLPAGLDHERFLNPGWMNAASATGGLMGAAPKMLRSMLSSDAAGALTNRPTAAFFTAAEQRGINAQERNMPRRAVMDRGEAFTPAADALDAETLLRWLARTQNIDGSWERDVERTAAALLGFLRAGQTPRKGSYRQVVRRAASWLAQNKGSGWAAFARFKALDALAQATGNNSDAAAAKSAQNELPEPANALEAAATGGPAGAAADPPVTLDDLRMAGISGEARKIPEALLRGELAALALTWAASIGRASKQAGKAG